MASAFGSFPSSLVKSNAALVCSTCHKPPQGHLIVGGVEADERHTD